MDEDELEAKARQRLGTTLRGKWRLDRLLGVGGMAAVYAGTHRNGSRGAIKVLHSFIAKNADIRQRFLREGYVANTVGHPGAVRVLDDDEIEDGSVFLVLELLEGSTLEAILQRNKKKLGLRVALHVVAELCGVLEAAHAKGIVHRDVKPENLFITRDGRLKLLDFGIARVEEGVPSRTRTGIALGTPMFMSPEQALGRAREIDARADVYSVGALFFAILTGRTPHDAETTAELLIRVATTPAPAIRSIAPNVPEDVAAIIDRALQHARDDRWPVIADMRYAVENAQRRLYGADAAVPNELAILAQAAPALAATAPMAEDVEAIAAALRAQAAQAAQSAPTASPRVAPTIADPAPPKPAPAPAPAATQYGAPLPSSGTPHGSPYSAGSTDVGPPLSPRTPDAFRSAHAFASGARSAAASAPDIARASTRDVLVGVIGGIVGIAGVGAFVAALLSRGAAADGESTSDAGPSPASAAAARSNDFVRVAAGAEITLGIDDDNAPPTVRGFRPSRNVKAPSAPFEIQQHEVTWGELLPWLTKTGKDVPPESAEGADLPASGVPWQVARDYCKDVFSGDLPTEEQWEHAARGADRRRYPWGNDPPDFSRTHAFNGMEGKPVKVMSRDQDRTPGPPGAAIYDLAGNVQEWTLSVWRSDTPAEDDSFAQGDDTSARAIRGWPLRRPAPKRVAELSIAWRDWVCATGPCTEWSGAPDAAPTLRAARLELWPDHAAAKPLAGVARRALESEATRDAMASCFVAASTKTTSFTVGASGDAPHGTILSLSSSSAMKPELAKCIGAALRDASRSAKLPAHLPEGEQTYDAVLVRSSAEMLPAVGFRCARPSK